MPKGVDAVFGGWQINGIMTFAKGLPIQISNGGNTTGLNSPGIWATENGQNPALSGAIANRLNQYFVQSDRSAARRGRSLSEREERGPAGLGRLRDAASRSPVEYDVSIR